MTDRTFTMDSGQVVPVFISDEAFRQWLDQRERLKGHYPDRPPDVDTSTMRSWTPHPFEQGYAKADQGGASVEGEPYYSKVVTWGGENCVKHIVARAEDGTFQEAVVLDMPSMRRNLSQEKGLKSPSWEERFEVLISSLVAALGEPDAIIITTPEDNAAMHREAEEIKAKIDDWYARHGVTQ